MNRLQAELQRLSFSPDAAGADAGSARAMVLELAGPPGWDALSRAWQGVQADLQLPAPAIAINGSDGYQLWFSVLEAVPVRQLESFLRALQKRYLADVPPDRVRVLAPGRTPPQQAAPGQWSAFLAPDLAGLFADERWLDLAPSPEAQGEVLARLQPMKASGLQRAMGELAASSMPVSNTNSGSNADHQDPRSFLLAVMNDASVDLKLRIEAAHALLRP